MIREVPFVSTTTYKSIEHVAETKTQLVKSRRIHVPYPLL
jgi:hypothetical protein